MARDPLSPEKTEELLKNVEVGRLGTCVDNMPYVTPVNFAYHTGKVYFHCGLKGRMLENLRRNPNVCFQLDADYRLLPAAEACKFTASYLSVMVFGRARILEDPGEKLHAMQAIIEKFSPPGPLPALEEKDLEDVNLVEITPEGITGADHLRPKA